MAGVGVGGGCGSSAKTAQASQVPKGPIFSAAPNSVTDF